MEGLLTTATKELSVETALPLVVRPSIESDVPAMLAIYEHHIRDGQSDLDAEFMAPEPLHDDDIKRRRKNMLRRRLPHLVAERGGAVVGYAYAVPFRKRPAYRYAVKHSIYVHPDHLHSGIGRAAAAGADRGLHARGLSPDVRLYRCRATSPSQQPARGLRLQAGRPARRCRLQVRPLDRQPADAARARAGRQRAAASAYSRTT